MITVIGILAVDLIVIGFIFKKKSLIIFGILILILLGGMFIIDKEN